MKTLLIACAMAVTAVAEPNATDVKADYPDVNAAKKHFRPKAGEAAKMKDTHWSDYAYARGCSRKDVSTLEVQYYSAIDDRYLYSDYFCTVSYQIKVGTVIAVPGPEFEVRSEFTYVGDTDNGRKGVFHGKEVLVDVVIGYPDKKKMPSEALCRQTVKNLAETGMQIPMSEGAMGRLISVKESARKRFGAKSAEVHYDCSGEGKLRILLWGCDETREKKRYRPGTYEGRSLARALTESPLNRAKQYR